MLSRLKKAVAALLLTIMLATLFSPHFVWEAMAQDLDYESDSYSLSMDSHEHDEGSLEPDHHDKHTCAGHMFGHTPAQASDMIMNTVPDTRAGYRSANPGGFVSLIPEAPLRPPRLRLA